MKTIFEAKQHLRDQYRSEEGFVGVGIGRHEDSEALRVYVADAHCPLMQRLKNNATFEGFPVIVEVTGSIHVFSA